jgi:hypothetical protein
VACTVVSGVGQDGQPVGGSGVQGAQHVLAGGGDVVDRAGLDGGDPQREPVRSQECLDVAAVLMGLSGVPQIDGFALPAPARPRKRGVLAVETGFRVYSIFLPTPIAA